MNKSELSIYALMCVGVFFCGVVWAPVFSGSTPIKDGLEVVSYLATVAACIAAILALKSWQAQFRYGKKFESLTALKLASDNISCATRHIRLFTRNQMRAQGFIQGEFPALEARATEVEQAWIAAEKDLSRAIDECELFVSAKFYREVFLLGQELTQFVRGYEYKFFELLEVKGITAHEIHRVERENSMQSDRVISAIQSTVRAMRLKEFPLAP